MAPRSSSGVTETGTEVRKPLSTWLVVGTLGGAMPKALIDGDGTPCAVGLATWILLDNSQQQSFRVGG